MTSPRLKTEIWFQVQLRLCDMRNIPMVLSRRGDNDAGAVIIKVVGPDDAFAIYAQTRGMDGERAWTRVRLAEPCGEAEAADYLAREVRRDPDIWIVEIEDRDGRYELDAPLA